jgi:hypothetical protein
MEPHGTSWNLMKSHKGSWCFCKPKCTYWGQQRSNFLQKEKLPQLSEFDSTCSKYNGWEIEARYKIKTDGNTMRCNLYSIQQKTNKSFAQFLPWFETELANAGALSLDNTIKISFLENAVSQSMQERLVSVFPVAMEYNALTFLLQTLGSRLDALQTPWKGRSQPCSTQNTNVDKMDWEPTRTFAAQSLANANCHAKWVSMEKIQRCRSNRLCICCGVSGHMISSCQ